MAGWNEKHLILELGILRKSPTILLCGREHILQLVSHLLLMGRIIELLKINTDRLIKDYIFPLFTRGLLECE